MADLKAALDTDLKADLEANLDTDPKADLKQGQFLWRI